MKMETWTCKQCGERYTLIDLEELNEMGESYHCEEGCFLCPDCWDSFRRLPLEEQAKAALTNKWIMTIERG